jgi:RsiW-degrading membrane proteinase PrsW (M82 family)
MDLATKEKFKWKFYRLAIMLNIIILLIGICILALFWMPEKYLIPVVLLIGLLVVGLTIYFWGQYRKTREWLDHQE